MGVITEKQLMARVSAKNTWLIESGPRGAGRFVARITPAGERLFYYRYTDSQGERVRLPLGSYDPNGSPGLTLKQARAKADEFAALYLVGHRDLREYLAQQQADERKSDEKRRSDEALAQASAELEEQRRLTVRQLFDRWVKTELAPRARGDGKRAGRKDGGKFTEDQFRRRIFPTLGHIAAVDLRKSDVLAVIDAVKAEGKLRTCNVLLANLKQMLRFAVAREIIPHNPLETITKRDAGGSDVERDRVLSVDEIKSLAIKLPNAGMGARSVHAIWLFLSTGARVGELMTARWEHVDIDAQRWYLPETKNQRPHMVHLSAFASTHFDALLSLREIDKDRRLTPWVFPNSSNTGPLDIKTFGKQVADRQRGDQPRMKRRTKNIDALILPGGKWTAHDLRRTAATLMASLDISTDVIDECLNHMLQSRVSRIYIRDRRESQQVKAFDVLGAKLAGTVSCLEKSDVVPTQECGMVPNDKDRKVYTLKAKKETKDGRQPMASGPEVRSRALRLKARQLASSGQGGGLVSLLEPNTNKDRSRLEQDARLYEAELVQPRRGKNGLPVRSKNRAVIVDDAVVVAIVEMFAMNLGPNAKPRQTSMTAVTNWILGQLESKDTDLYKLIETRSPDLLETQPSDRWWRDQFSKRRKVQR